MASLRLAPRSGLEHVLVANRSRLRADAGVLLVLPADRALAIVTACRGRLQALLARVRETFGAELVDSPRCVVAGPIGFAWAGPGQWLAMHEHTDGAAFEQRLRAALGSLASVSDQSDGRTRIRVGGTRARDALAKGVPVDLHPRAFRPGDAAVTIVAHVGSHLWQVDDVPTYEFIVPRSFAAAFVEWLIDSAAEFGVAIAREPVS
jgi:methylglutamate dehydrogenase subunit D